MQRTEPKLQTHTHPSENKLATVTPLSNLVTIAAGASVTYDGTSDVTVAAATVDIVAFGCCLLHTVARPTERAAMRRLASWSIMVIVVELTLFSVPRWC